MSLQVWLPLTEFLPDLLEYGKAAGMIRNKDIITNADYVLILWDGLSKGTKTDIDLCKRYNKPYYLHNINDSYRIYSIGIPDIFDAKDTPGWKTWVGMLKRVTTKDSYKDVRIDPSWLMFSQFLKWYIAQDKIPGWQMDKDLLSGHTLYSSDTCVFLPKEINLLLLRKRGYEIINGGYVPVIYKEGNAIKGKNYVSSEEALGEYIKMKKEYMKELVNLYSLWIREDIQDKLLNYNFI